MLRPSIEYYGPNFGGIMNSRGIPKHLTEVIRNTYDKTKTCIMKTLGEMVFETIIFDIRQHCSMLPALFNLYLDDGIRT